MSEGSKSFIVNDFGQPVGLPVDLVLPRPRPPHVPLHGTHVALEPMADHHAEGFWEAFTDPSGWTYLGEDTPYQNLDHARDWTAKRVPSRDPLFYTVMMKGQPAGFLSLMRITPQAASIEVGYIHFSPRLTGTIAATEAQFLLMCHVFEDLGYRRYEWKCDALNAPSRRAALRLGFTFEGIFRQALITKGRNRDTAWFSMLDREWPPLKHAYQRWLAAKNFDSNGHQFSPLSALTKAALAGVTPDAPRT